MTDQYTSELEKQNEELQQRLAVAEKRVEYLDKRIKLDLEPFCARWATIVHATMKDSGNSSCVISQAKYDNVRPYVLPYILKQLGRKRNRYSSFEILCTFCNSHVWSIEFIKKKHTKDTWGVFTHANRAKRKYHGSLQFRGWTNVFNIRATKRGWSGML